MRESVVLAQTPFVTGIDKGSRGAPQFYYINVHSSQSSPRHIDPDYHA